jgi:hypothetical protein
MIPSPSLSLACAVVLAALLKPLAFGHQALAASPAATFALATPTDWQVVQRTDAPTTPVSLGGQAPAGSRLEWRYQLLNPPGGTNLPSRRSAPRWLPLGTAPASGPFAFHADLPAGGWYQVEVRCLIARQPIATNTLAHLGVGEVFLIAGQSNAANHGSERQHPESGLVTRFDGTRWSPAHDPQTGASGDAGSFLPAFGDALARQLHVPVGVVPLAQGATSVREWLPAGTVVERATTTGANVRPNPAGTGWQVTGDLFERIVRRMTALGPHGFRAVLWHQGESDAGQARSGYPAAVQISGADYERYLTQLVTASRQAAGWPVPWVTAQTTYHGENDPADAEFRAAQAKVWANGLTERGPDTDALRVPFRDGVHFNALGLRRHGELWAEAVTAWLAKTAADPKRAIRPPVTKPGAAAPLPPTPPWFERVRVGLEVGPTGAQFGGSAADAGYAARFDGREIVQRSVASHAEYLVIWARDGEWAYYDSHLQPKCPGLGSRDVLREAVEEGRKTGLPILAYCVQQSAGETLRSHPEWRMVGADGRPIDGRVCLRSGYREFMKQMLTEQLAYGIDGFHLDMVDQGFGAPYGCWCATCQKEFTAQHGKPMPKGVSWDEDWDRMLEFRYASSEGYEKELAAHVQRVNPRATVDFNYHGNPPFSFEVGQLPVRHARQGDFVTGETGIWGFSALGVGLNAEFYRAATPGRPFQIAMQRGVRMYHDQTTRPLADQRWELFNLLAHGAFVTMVDKTGFDGWLDPVAYERFGALFQEVKAKTRHFGQAPVAEVGLYFSSRTRDWVGREKPADVFAAFQGAHKALVYEHLPWGVVHSEQLTLATLQRFRVVVLPNAGILSPAEVALFRQYVEAGGQLLATGLTGTFDSFGRSQPEGSLAELAGVKFERRLDSTDNWVRFGTQESAPLVATVAPGNRRDWPFLVRGPAAVFRPTTAQAFGELLRPHRTHLHAQKRYAEDWPLSPDQPVGPALFLHRVGRGQVLTLAASPDTASATDHHTVEARQLLTQAIRWLNPRPRIQIQAPATVETVVTDDPATRQLRVHLLGYASPPQTTPAKDRPYVLPGLMEAAPMYRVTVTLAERPQAVEALHPATRIRRRDRQIEATVEDVHEVLVIRY